MRRESEYYLGEVRTPIGTPLERIASRVPVHEVVRNAFSHGLSSRGMLAGAGAPYVLTGEILDLHGDQVVRPAGYASIRVNVVRSSTGQIVYSRTYSGERESNIYRPGSGSPVPAIRELISRALQDAVDHALDDRSLRDRLNPDSSPYGPYR
jgi:curli biogenesis system outer membrane secretion channel CsgG